MNTCTHTDTIQQQEQQQHQHQSEDSWQRWWPHQQGVAEGHGVDTVSSEWVTHVVSEERIVLDVRRGIHQSSHVRRGGRL